MRTSRTAVSSVVLAACCLGLMAFIPHAQAAAPAPGPVSWAQLTPGTDWSAQIINDLFPVGNPNAAQAGLAGEQTAIGTMIGYLNGFVLLLAMAFVAYATIIELHRGAETGRVLSERTSSWAPVRMGFAAIMMVPLAGGFTVGQAGVIKVALWGVGMARMVYDAGIDAIGSQGLPVTTPQIPNTEPIVAALINNELCMALINAAAGNAKVILPPIPVTSTTPTGGIQTWNYALNGNQTGAPTCGSVKLKEANSAGTSFDGVNISMAGPQLTDINYLIATSIRPAVQQVAARFWQDRSTADLQPLWGILVNATNAYTQMLTRNASSITQQLNAAKATSGSLDTTTTQMKDLGWAGAGAYFWKIAQINGETLSYLNVTPTVMPPSYRGLGPALTSDLTPLVNAVTAFNREIYQLALTNDSTNAPTGLSDRPPKDKSGLMSYAFNLMHLNQVVLNNMVALISPTANSWTNPFIAMVGLGDTMIAASMAGYGTVAALNAATSKGLWAKLGRITPIGAASAAAGKVLNTGVLGKLIFWMLAALLVPGLLLAFVIPMIPLTMWLAGVASWFILVIEAIIAVPLWMFAHMSYQGEGFHGRAYHGYSLLFNVLFRPVLMLFGLMLGYWLFTVMSWLTFLTYSLATDFVLQQGYLVVNFFGVIVLTCMLVSIEMAWEVMAFRLISQIPYQVVQWIGFKPASRVDMENFAQETTTQGSREVLQWTDQNTQRLLGGAAGSGGYSALSYGGGSSYNPPRLTGPGGGPRGNGGGGGAAAQTDSTLSAASTVVPPASSQPAEGG